MSRVLFFLTVVEMIFALLLQEGQHGIHTIAQSEPD